MIPKILHYCWFGRGQMGPVALKCMESWKKYCPDYQIKCGMRITLILVKILL